MAPEKHWSRSYVGREDQPDPRKVCFCKEVKRGFNKIPHVCIYTAETKHKKETKGHTRYNET